MPSIVPLIAYAGTVPDLGGALRRLVLGRPTRPLVPGTPGASPRRIRFALPNLAPDALSSSAYAPDQILIALGAGGLAALTVSPWVGLAVVVLMVLVMASYGQTINAYPHGGDYQVAKTNLGRVASVSVGGAMMVDGLLAVAVSVSASAHYLAAVFPALRPHIVGLATGIVVFLALATMRDTKTIGRFLVGVVYAFLLVVGVTALAGAAKWLSGGLPAGLPDAAAAMQATSPLTALAWAGLVARAFASGAVALTGVQTIAQSVSIFREPRPRNAIRSMVMLGASCIALLIGVLVLANHLGLQVGNDSIPILAQVFEAVFGPAGWLFATGTLVVVLLLAAAASAALRWTPALMALLARDALLPKQFYRRGDRRVAANGIVLPAIGALALIWLFSANVTRLIGLYIIAVFMSFALGQLGMVRHFSALLPLTKKGPARRNMFVARAVNWIGLVATMGTLLVVLVTKFTGGAWLSPLLVALAVLTMLGVNHHYRVVARDLGGSVGNTQANALPSRVHAIVLVSAVSKATARAIAYARATRPATLEVVTVAIDQKRLDQLRADWERARLPVKLRIIDAPTYELTRPVIEYITSLRRRSPGDLVMLFLPEKIVRHWWERLIHNRSAAHLESRLKNIPGVVIALVPWQLEHADE